MTSKKRDFDPVKQALFNPRIDRKQFISAFKSEGYKEFKKKVKKAYCHPFTQKYIQGLLLPNNYEEIRSLKSSYFSDNLEGELAWLVESFNGKDDLLNDFIKFEDDLQNKILEGDYNEANNILENIKSKVCYSYWGLEIEYFLIDKIEGTEGNWKRKNELNELLSNKFSIFLNQVFSKKAEKGFSSKDYHRSLYNEIRNSSNFDFEYLNFRLANHLMPKYELITFFAFVDSNSSLIDRYFSSLSLFTELLSSDYNKYNSLVREIIEENLVNIKDTRLDRIREIIGAKEYSIKNEDPFQNILENYSNSNYEICLNQIPELLKKSPSQVELWDIYIKSLIETKSEFKLTNVSDFLDNILEKIYQVYNLSGSVEDTSDQILKSIVSLPNFNFSNQLLHLLRYSNEINSTYKKRILQFCIGSKYFNPLVTTFLSDETKIATRLYPITMDSLDFINGRSNNKTRKISSFKEYLYQIRNLFSQEKFEELIEFVRTKKNPLTEENLYTEEITLILYVSYLKTNEIDNAIDLYVNSYFRNKNLLSRIDADELIDKIIESDYNVSTKLNLATLFVIEDLDFYYQFVGLEMWLNSLGLENPSQIDIEIVKDRNKVVYLLGNGCKIEVLEKFYYLFESHDELIEERKNILKNLIKGESDNYDPFIDELASIVQKQKIQSVLSEVNSGRIRLSSDMLGSEENNFKNNYNRYKLISDFSSYNDLTMYDGKELLKDFFQNLTELKSESLDPAFYTFRSLVNEMIDSFLFNKKNGLDGDLSTRIRHGELENQLRSIFDRNHLISKKDDNDKYENISLWESTLEARVKKENIENVQNILKNFSGNIDKIIQFLVRQQIQVYSENYTQNKYGFFNFGYNDSYWDLIHKESLQVANNYNEFKDYIYSIIKLTTEKILQDIRKYFSTKLQEDLNRELDNLNLELLNCISQSNSPELFQNIIDAKRDLQNEISDLTEWFIVSDSAIDKSMDIKTLLQTSFESHNIKHPNTIIVPEIEADDSIFLYNYKHFIYIILNLIDNVRRHAKLDINDLKVITKANFFKEEQVLEFSIRNNFNTELISKEDLIFKFLRVKENWNKDVDRQFVNLEGGTGFEKIKKILVYDIKSKNHDFKFHIEDQFLEIGFRINITQVTTPNILNDGN